MPAGKRRGKASGFSISSTLKGENRHKNSDEPEEDPLAPQEGKPREDFTQEQLDGFYRTFVDEVKKQNKPRIVATLDNKSPERQDDTTARLTLENKTQLSYYKEVRTDLVQFLRQKLNNYSLEIETEIVAGSQKTEPYSAEEKYQYLLEKNPELAELRKRLKLDLE